MKSEMFYARISAPPTCARTGEAEDPGTGKRRSHVISLCAANSKQQMAWLGALTELGVEMEKENFQLPQVRPLMTCRTPTIKIPIFFSFEKDDEQKIPPPLFCL